MLAAAAAGQHRSLGRCVLTQRGLERCAAPLVLGPGAWSWFEDQRAVHIDRDGLNEVVVGWLDPAGDVVIRSMPEHGPPVQTVLVQMYEDDHIAPALSVEPDDRITVYWSAHNGRHLYYQTTSAPGEITTWGPRQEVPSNAGGRRGFTYPNPVILSAEANQHYLFWRGGDWEPTFADRTAEGTWGPAREIIDVPGRRPYVKVATNGRDRIGLAFTNGHPDNDVTSLYFIAIRHGEVLTAAGRRLGALGGPAIRPSARDLVYSARRHRGVRCWVQDVAFDEEGRPVILYTLYPRRAVAQYWYALWSGGRWHSHRIAIAGPSIQRGEPHYVGGAVLDHAHPEIVYLATVVHRHYQVERWTTPDDGWRWARVSLTAGASDNIRPVLAQELPGSSRVASTVFALRGRYFRYAYFHTSVEMLSSSLGLNDGADVATNFLSAQGAG